MQQGPGVTGLMDAQRVEKTPRTSARILPGFFGDVPRAFAGFGVKSKPAPSRKDKDIKEENGAAGGRKPKLPL